MSNAVGPAHAARVEVLHDKPVARFGGADDGDRVGERLMVVVGALDKEVAALQPLERRPAGDCAGRGSYLTLWLRAFTP